jgi:arylsulfatase
LRSDPGETTDVAAQHPEIVKKLSGLAEAMRAELGDELTGRKGAHVRPAG